MNRPILNPNMKEVVRNEVIKLLDNGIKWVSPTQVRPKKFGVTVITNEKNELIPTRIITGWSMCIDYRKLNSMTRKDHFPLPCMDQILKRVVGHEFYYFLDDYSSYNQIEIAFEYQEKLLSHVHLVLLHIEGCLLDYVMHQPRFKYTCLVYSVIWLNVF